MMESAFGILICIQNTTMTFLNISNLKPWMNSYTTIRQVALSLPVMITTNLYNMVPNLMEFHLTLTTLTLR